MPTIGVILVIVWIRINPQHDSPHHWTLPISFSKHLYIRMLGHRCLLFLAVNVTESGKCTKKEKTGCLHPFNMIGLSAQRTRR